MSDRPPNSIPPEGEEDDAAPAWLIDVHELVEEGRFEEALARLARVDAEGSVESEEEEGDRWLSETSIRLELGDLDGAETALGEASARLEPSDPAWLRMAGWLRLERWDTEGARACFETIPPEWLEPFDLEKLSVLADLEERYDDADTLLAEANELDPDASPIPPRLFPDQFEALIAEAAESLPPQFREAFAEVAVVIDPMPTAAILDAPASGLGPEILGLFAGWPLSEEQAAGHGELPPRIFLFQRNLERTCWNRDDLCEQIQITLFHELGHALGFEEEGLDDLGLA